MKNADDYNYPAGFLELLGRQTFKRRLASLTRATTWMTANPVEVADCFFVSLHAPQLWVYVTKKVKDRTFWESHFKAIKGVHVKFNVPENLYGLTGTGLAPRGCMSVIIGTTADWKECSSMPGVAPNTLRLAADGGDTTQCWAAVRQEVVRWMGVWLVPG